MPKQNLLSFRKNFNISSLSSTVAEDDPNLAQYYISPESYLDRALDREDQCSVFIGPKGAGKSAVLQMVRNHGIVTGNSNRIIDIAPDDLAFNALLNIDTRTPLLSSPGQHQWLFTSLWDYVLCAELLQRDSVDRGTLESLLRTILGAKNQQQQKQLLKLTLNDEGKQNSMTDKMLSLISAIEIEGSYGDGKGKARVELIEPTPTNTDLQLLQLIANVAKSLPKSLTHDYYILIDDLDLHWTGSPLQNAFLASMFQTIKKLSRSSSVKFVVSLRKAIYREISFSERDKFHDYVCEVEWQKKQIQQMVNARISFGLNIAEKRIWTELFPPNSFDFLWGNTDGMPREALRLAILCIEKGIKNGEKWISPDTINDATFAFSEARRDELASQFNFQYPGLSYVLRFFSGRPKEFDSDIIQEVGMQATDLVDKNTNLRDMSWATCGFADPLALARALLHCGFLLLKDGRSARARVPDEVELQMIDKSKWFAIHPMYHSGLGLDGYSKL